MSQKIEVVDSYAALAAAMGERAHELLADGWVQGRFIVTDEDMPVTFCIEGAIALAWQEITAAAANRVTAPGFEAEMLRVFILDEAKAQYSHDGGSIPSFNDRTGRTQDEVLSVVRKATDRLWDLSLDDGIPLGQAVDLSAYTDVDVAEEGAQQFLHAALA